MKRKFNFVKEKIVTNLNNHKMITFIFIIIMIIFVVWSITVLFGKKVELSCENIEVIALEKTGGGIVMECKLKRKVYEVEVIYKDYEYEFKINANTGEIIGYDIDYIDEND